MDEKKLEPTKEELEFLVNRRKAIDMGRISMTQKEHEEHIKKIWPQIEGIIEKAIEKGAVKSISYDRDFKMNPKEKEKEGVAKIRPTGESAVIVVIGEKPTK